MKKILLMVTFCVMPLCNCMESSQYHTRGEAIAQLATITTNDELRRLIKSHHEVNQFINFLENKDLTTLSNEERASLKQKLEQLIKPLREQNSLLSRLSEIHYSESQNGLLGIELAIFGFPMITTNITLGYDTYKSHFPELDRDRLICNLLFFGAAGLTYLYGTSKFRQQKEFIVNQRIDISRIIRLLKRFHHLESQDNSESGS